MKVLVVHDRREVANEIVELVHQTLGADETVEVAEDQQSAREHLRQSIFDLLIMDLTIPFFKNGAASVSNPDFKAVEQLLHELFNHNTLNVPGDVIGLTKDHEALSLVGNSLGPHLMVALREDEGNAWKGYLVDKIKYARRAFETRSILINRHYNVDALILTAMDKEMRPYRELFELTPLKHFEGASEFLFTDKADQVRKGIAYSIGKSGQPSAASWAQSLISYFRPKVALMSGYCGGVEGRANFGDLIFFEAAYAWDYGKWTEKKDEKTGSIESTFLSRPDPIDIADSTFHRIARSLVDSDRNRDLKFLKKIQELSKGELSSLQFRLCPAASGSAVVANDSIVEKIQGLNDSIRAVDMEAYGFYHAAKHTRVIKPSFMCLKAVADHCNGEKEDRLHEACSYISAAIAADIITKDWAF